MNSKSKVFLSYSHSDKAAAQKLAEELRKAGIDIWYDRWEIQIGDSLVQRIFSEGLSECKFFLILLSNSSMKSKWVQEELNSAIITKIQGITRVVPILLEKVELPASIRSLLWIDLSNNFEYGIRELVKAIYEVDEKPPLGKIPDYVKELHHSIGGLSKEASTISMLFVKNQDLESGYEKAFIGQDIKALIPILTVQEISDAVDELGEYGFVRIHKYLGTFPYEFGDVEPTYALFMNLAPLDLGYDPFADVLAVAAAVTAKDKIRNEDLQSYTKMPPTRLNRAVNYLEDYGTVKVLKHMGTTPFDFGSVWATPQTRRFVKDNSK